MLRRHFASWTFRLLFRRPTLCLLGSCFKQLPRPEHNNITYEVPKASREDLVLLASLSPFLMTHLDATHFESIVCTDASDNCLGAVGSPISQNLHRELWRHRDRRGWASYLVGKAAEHIIACAPEFVQASCFPRTLLRVGRRGMLMLWEARRGG